MVRRNAWFNNSSVTSRSLSFQNASNSLLVECPTMSRIWYYCARARQNVARIVCVAILIKRLSSKSGDPLLHSLQSKEDDEVVKLIEEGSVKPHALETRLKALKGKLARLHSRCAHPPQVDRETNGKGKRSGYAPLRHV